MSVTTRPEGLVPHDSIWWDEFWSDRDKHFGPPRESLVQLILAHALSTSRKPTDMRLVDIGSGNGRYAIPFAGLGFQTTAIERSDAGCSLIKSRAAEKNVEGNLTIVQGDILAVADSAVKSSSFDVVFSSGLLEEIDKADQETALRNITRAAKPGGLLVLKHCLEIDGRGITVEEGSVPDFFSKNDDWQIRTLDTDPDMRASIATISFESSIRTETIIASRL